MLEDKNSRIIKEILMKYSMNISRYRWQDQKFLTKKLDKIYFVLKIFWTIFFSLTCVFLTITLIIVLGSLKSYIQTKRINPDILPLLYTGVACFITFFIFGFTSIIFCRLNPEKKFVLDFNKWIMKKMIFEMDFQFESIKKIEFAPTNEDIKLIKEFLLNPNLETAENLKEKDESKIDFIFDAVTLESHFKITTTKNLVFHLKYARIVTNFQNYENENFLIIDSKFINGQNRKLLEQVKFKFLKQKQEKFYFLNPNRPLNIFKVLVEKSTFSNIIKVLKLEIEKKFYQLDQLAKIINNEVIHEENSI
ncbi:hypothetical protein CIB43_00503 [Mesomycoplasma hyopneumoniae]|uniref:Uncharacterized protein n=2 Tax=Mesomycoplasma hyopneumoniae TaxID=2099 RepID=A0A223MA07_MESHO|nr:hypothetical protein CIB43_00503 [Mesomycoplasma hyopneumoniae]